VKVEEAATGARPYEYADPRSLSQAWYDALYGASAAPVRGRDAATTSTPSVTKAAGERSAGSSAERRSETALVPPRTLSRTEHSILAGNARENGVSQRPKRTASEPEAGLERPSARTNVELVDANGNTALFLLRRNHSGIDVVAVAESEGLDAVAEALTQATIALAARGIRVTHEIRVKERT